MGRLKIKEIPDMTEILIHQLLF